MFGKELATGKKKLQHSAKKGLLDLNYIFVLCHSTELKKTEIHLQNYLNYFIKFYNVWLYFFSPILPKLDLIPVRAYLSRDLKSQVEL